MAMGLDRLTGPAERFPRDIHAQRGLGCVDCHVREEGNPDPHAGFGGAPQRRDIPELCGRCHSDADFMRQFNPSLRVDQVTEYWTSGHGRRLREQNDEAVATCTDCHISHEIRPPGDPASGVHPLNVVDTCAKCHSDAEMMAGRAPGTGQVAEYRRSVHGRLLLDDHDLSAPACNDCHGNHGAAPPGVTSVRNVCGQCHVLMADYFAETSHATIFNLVGMPGCATCHGDHAVEAATDASLLTYSAEVCTQCHQEDDERGHAFERMAFMLDSLHYVSSLSRDVLHRAENFGMEVSQALFELEEIESVLHRARGAVHTFRSEAVQEEVDQGLTLATRGLEQGENALAEYRLRNLSVALFAFIVVLLIVALVFKIRQLDERLEEILGSVSVFFHRSLAVPMGTPTGADLRLAACALLLEAAYADDSFTEEEREHLVDMIRWHFGIPHSEAEELIRLAEEQRTGVGDVGRVARMIADNFSDEQKGVLLEELWELVHSDGELAKREVAFMEDVAELLGAHPDVVDESRRAAAASHAGSNRDT